MLYSVVSGVASTAVSFIPFVGSRSSTPTKQRLQASTNSELQGEEDENASSATLYKAPVPPNALATHQSTSLVLHRLATTSPLLPVQLAELITALSIAARVSLRASALFAEAILEGARVGTGTGMGLSRRAIIAALGSARWMREITAGGTNRGEEDKFLQVLDHYTNLGIYMVHHAFTLGELFTMSGFYLASSTVSFSFAAGEESVRMLDSLFGSNETSRALSAFITLLGREMNSGKFGEMRGILGTGRKFFALTKSLTVWACLQSVTHRRTVKGMKMRVLWDCTVCERQNLVTSPEGREEGHEMEKKERERLISDVRSAKEFGRTWRDEMTESKREKRLSLAPMLSRATTASTIRSRPETELGNPINAGDEGEEGEIVFELMQLIGDDDESEVKIEDLPHDVRDAIERLERGDETGLEVVKRGKGMDGTRLVRSEEKDTVYEIETTTTVTTTTVVRVIDPNLTSSVSSISSTVGATSTELDVPQASTSSHRSRNHTRNSSILSHNRFSTVSSMLEESEWVDVESALSAELERSGTATLSRPTSIAEQSRREMYENPEEGKAKLGMLVKTMTKRLTKTTKTVKRMAIPSFVTPVGSDEENSPDKIQGRFSIVENEGEKTPLRSESSTSLATIPTARNGLGRNGTLKDALKKARKGLSRKATAEDLQKTVGKTRLRNAQQSASSVPFPSASHGQSLPRSPTSRKEFTKAENDDDSCNEVFGSPRYSANRLRKPSAMSMRSSYTARTHLETTAKGEDDEMHGFWPCSHLVANIQRFMKYSSAAYGQHFMRILGIGTFPDKAFPTTSKHSHNHWAFAWHTKLSVDDILLSSYTESESFTNTKLSPLVHYVSLDHEIKSVVLTMRGTIGLSDILVDLTCDYDDISVDGGSPEGIYRVHSGMWHSALLLRSGTVRDVVKTALEEHPDYGVVLTGHSLGGGTAALLSLIWSSPSHLFLNQRAAKIRETAEEVHHPPIRTEFVTSLSSGLPPGRPIAAFCYGIPAVASSDLTTYCKGLITSVVYNWDVVPTLSLGLFRDLKNVAINLSEEGNLSEEIVGRVVGIYQRRFRTGKGSTPTSDPPPPALTDLDPSTRNVKLSAAEMSSGRGQNQALLPTYQDPALIEPPDEDQELNNWFYSLIKTLRASNDNEKLFPPGTVYVVEQHDSFISQEEENRESRQRLETVEGKRILLRQCEDVEARFCEPVFCRSMFFDHSPSSYEITCDLLARAVRPQS